MAPKGIQSKHVILTKDLSPEVEEAFLKLLGQLPIVWAKREGGVLRVPIAEADDTAGYILDFHMEGNEFVFTLKRVQVNKA